MVYMVTFTINISPMLAYIPYMDPMGYIITLNPWLPLNSVGKLREYPTFRSGLSLLTQRNDSRSV